MSYGPSFIDNWRRAAAFVDKILKGASPSDIPIEQPTQFELTVNMNNAKATGLMFPKSFGTRDSRDRMSWLGMETLDLMEPRERS